MTDSAAGQASHESSRRTETAIEAVALCKSFKTPVAAKGRFSGIRSMFSREYTVKEAVTDIGFTVEKGDFVGYIGPNGAGKSTTIKMLTGILHPSSGSVKLAGIDPHRDRTKCASKLGVVFGQRSQLWWDLPVKDSYDILAHMYGVEEKDKLRRLPQFDELLALGEFWDTPVRKLSLGQRMRADIAAAMLHDPDLLFLDEPTIGLDVNAKRNIRGFLKILNEEFGKTILLTTHDMDDIEQLCRRVMVIGGGQLTYDGTIEGPRREIGLPTEIKITYQGRYELPDEWNAEDAAQGPADLFVRVDEAGPAGAAGGEPPTLSSASGVIGRAELPRMRIVSRGERTLTVEVNRQEVRTMDALRELGRWGEIDDVEMREPDFEEIIRRVYG
ncbi:ABC transporter ATP-binding protein [Saccharibacillus alkalitolerans]|uniref:ATP-binding cassette domain-containing protein n=1 Tax=Saccharibacillus alkalitolerans TaxID=2705290 RepID=A0ABX0F532_9BACL|nr:ATP-binding cassette domain-containing protein [Saccharibacillus alkalitolerans]NGZ75129.1 ATP-binding cassette domain-containing protein [Saccharibacillus alkalitolerans]